MSSLPDSEGRIARIWLRPGARLPVREVETATAIVDEGLDGDHAVPGSKRQVTLLCAERWQEACTELGRDVDPAARRANVLIEGIPLDVHRGALLRLGHGGVELCVEGETRPCELLDDTGGVGLNAALRADVRAGIYGRVVTGGVIQVGDPVRWVAAPAG